MLRLLAGLPLLYRAYVFVLRGLIAVAVALSLVVSIDRVLKVFRHGPIALRSRMDRAHASAGLLLPAAARPRGVLLSVPLCGSAAAYVQREGRVPGHHRLGLRAIVAQRALLCPGKLCVTSKAAGSPASHDGCCFLHFGLSNVSIRVPDTAF